MLPDKFNIDMIDFPPPNPIGVNCAYTPERYFQPCLLKFMFIVRMVVLTKSFFGVKSLLHKSCSLEILMHWHSKCQILIS